MLTSAAWVKPKVPSPAPQGERGVMYLEESGTYSGGWHSYWSVSDLQAEVIMNYHVGETVLSLQKTTLIPGGSESLVYTTLSGGIGILVPFTSHEVSLHIVLTLSFRLFPGVVSRRSCPFVLTCDERFRSFIRNPRCLPWWMSFISYYTNLDTISRYRVSLSLESRMACHQLETMDW